MRVFFALGAAFMALVWLFVFLLLLVMFGVSLHLLATAQNPQEFLMTSILIVLLVLKSKDTFLPTLKNDLELLRFKLAQKELF